MPSFTHRTISGDVDFTLRRRGHVWHYDFDNHRQRGSTKHSDLKQARITTEREIERSLRTNSLDLTLDAAITRYIDERWPAAVRINNNSYIDVKSRLGSFRKSFGDRLITVSAEIVKEIAQGWLDERKAAGKSAVNTCNDQRAMSRLFSWLMVRNIVQWAYNPAQRARLDVPRPEIRIKPPADEGELEKLMRLEKDAPIFPVLVLMQSGFRGTGACRLEWSAIHLDGNPTVEVPIEKGRTRTIPLGAWAARHLRAWRKARPDDFFAYPYSLSQCHQELQELRQKHGLGPRLTLGSLRRLTYRRLFDGGVAPQLAAKIMGSSVPVALKHYVELETLTAHKAVNALKPSQNTAQSRNKKKRTKLVRH